MKSQFTQTVAFENCRTSTSLFSGKSQTAFLKIAAQADPNMVCLRFRLVLKI